MQEPQGVTLGAGYGREADWDGAFADVLAVLDRLDEEPHGADEPQAALRCVSNGYLDSGCSCGQSVPAAAAGAAWRRELARGSGRDDRFFRFAWMGEVWLGFGLGDGSVRGVYCPAHSARRDERASAAGTSPPAA
ncbi:MAG TPA: hypothetical protein VGN25_10175 [Solirubrobacteraceae bacterium]|jgi:hypothetical protein|nr:hypothetical protein [Solirubrobacteraceae bacterium]